MLPTNEGITIEIPGRLPGLNEIIRTDRGNRYAGANLKKIWTKVCAQIFMLHQVPPFEKPVTIKFEWIEKDARRDLDNICAGGVKSILDGMVLAGCLRNDTRQWVKGFTHTFPEPDKDNPRVRITVQEAA